LDASAWALILISGMLILPETPRYLIRSGNPEKAARSLSKLRRLPEDHAAIRDELGEITANHEYELSLGKATYLDCFRGNLLKRQLTGCGLQALQQLTGINVGIGQYPSPAFEQLLDFTGVNVPNFWGHSVWESLLIPFSLSFIMARNTLKTPALPMLSSSV
jgi:Sugar (and other) transporter